MKKFDFLNPTSHRGVVVGLLCLAFAIFGVGVSTASVAIYKNKEQANPTIIYDDVIRQIEAESFIEEASI